MRLTRRLTVRLPIENLSFTSPNPGAGQRARRRPKYHTASLLRPRAPRASFSAGAT